MRRWTILGLCLLALALVAAPASAQKLLVDSQVGYTMYTHNWVTLNNGMDVNGGGYVYYFANSGLFGGPSSLGDDVRKCWSSNFLRGGQESTLGGPTMSSWAFLDLANVVIVTGVQTLFTVGEVGTGSDSCIAPFTANVYYLLGGYQLPPINFGLPAGAWQIAFFSGIGAGGPLPLPAFATLNNGLCLSGEMIYDLQNGYNGSANNQQYLGLISVDEITFPHAGGMANGDTSFGSNEWFGIVNNGGVVSFTRIFDAPIPPFGGGNYGVLLLPGQSVEGAGDGLESYHDVAWTQSVAMGGRNNGVPDNLGQQLTMYGAGGKDWVSCATSTAIGSTTNKINLRTLDYEYGQYNSAGSAANDPGHDYYVEWYWTRTLPAPCTPFTQGSGQPVPYDGSSKPLDFGCVWDGTTTAFNTNPKALANIKFGASFTGDVTAPNNFILLFDGCDPASVSDPISIGVSRLPRGDAQLLSICHPKAVAQLNPARSPYCASALVWQESTGGLKKAMETTTTVHLPIF